MKYCPILSYRREGYSDICCKEERCEWWNKTEECCAIKSFLLKDFSCNPNFPDYIRIEEDEGYIL